MLLAGLVATSADVAANSARNVKVARLADLLRRLDPEEVAPAVCMLAGEARQGRIGIGWATLARLQRPAATEPTLTVGDLDTALDSIRTTTGPGSVQVRGELIASLSARATPGEQDLIRRLLVGELRHGALEGVMADAIARAADVPAAAVRRALMLSGDLGSTAATALRDGAGGLAAIGLRLLTPVQPMLASPAEDVAEALTGPCSVEWKVDGVRIQAHRMDDEVRLYTRNGNDVTARLPAVAGVVLGLPATALVLDGEVVALDEQGRPHAFQDTMGHVARHDGAGSPTVAASPTVAGSPTVVPFFFDVLHVDGRDLIDRPLQERLGVLAQVAGGRRMPAIETSDPADAESFLEQALAAGHEGVMVKSLDSTYQAGRRGKSWRKVKPSRTLDLVVLAVEWGHGRRRGTLSNLHLGARGTDGGFVMVGKTFKGLTDELLAWQTARFLELETERRGIAVHVRPEQVVEIELDGVQVSRRYPGGVALRFARVKRYRPDKSPAEADTIETVQAMLAR